MRNKNLETYINSDNLNQALGLDQSGNLFFHWADWKNSCEQKFDSCDLADFNQVIDVYKSVPLWMHYNSTKLKSNLYELYNHYLKNDSKNNGSFFISIGKEVGPYMNYHSLSWINESILKNIVYQKLLSGELDKRHFRLYWKTRPKLHLEKFYKSKIDLSTHAITHNGLIFKLIGQNNLGRILNSNKILMELDLNPFLRTVRSGISDFMKDVSTEDFSGKALKNTYEFILDSNDFIKCNHEIKAGNNSSYHLFLPYEKIQSVMSNFYLEAPMKRFLENTQNSFELNLCA